jgi:sialic acid synthase SpsE/CMP-N-acetylneuraminic acid synthetase
MGPSPAWLKAADKPAMKTLGIILARAGSKGLTDKCVRSLLGRALIEYTFRHALASKRLDAVVLTTDSEPAKALARKAGIEIVDRPPELAHDAATVDAAARHAVEAWESRHGQRADVIVLLYGNIPVRAPGLIDQAVEHLARTGADSVRSVAPVTKQHPDWVHRLEGDRMVQFRPNSIYRRQDLAPLYYHDGAAVAVTRGALFGATPGDHQSFLGCDRRGIVQSPEDAVDVDGPMDLLVAEAVLRSKGEQFEADEFGGSAVDALNAGSQYRCFNDSGEPARHPWSGPGKTRKGSSSDGLFFRSTRWAGLTDRARSWFNELLESAESNPGPGVCIIAEAGVNHDGSVEKALQLVDTAVEAGADAVKFQMFRADDLACASAATAPYQQDRVLGKTQREMLADLELSPAEFARIKEHCDQAGIVFLATPFGVPELRWLAELGVPAIKIASTDLVNVPLIEATVATGLPLILSTGAATEQEINGAFQQITDAGAGDRVVLMHCVSAYPTPVEELNLRAIAALRESFGVPCGFSDHSSLVESGGWAVAVGACILEKHFTLDRDAPGPDHAMSMNPIQLRDYVKIARAAAAAAGHGRLGFRVIEEPVRRLARRSVTAAVDIACGSVLRAGMLALKRPGDGIAAGDMSKLIGLRVNRAIPVDTTLQWDMVDRPD